MNWKLSTFILVGLLLITLVTSYVITSGALRAASIAEEAGRKHEIDLASANSAVNDTKSFLNFFRLTETDKFTADDYRHEIETLNMKYIGRFPHWAESQVKIHSLSEDDPKLEGNERLIYTEFSSLFRQEGQQEILFSKLPDGTKPLKGANVDSAYQSLGVTFSCSTPERLENLKKSVTPLGDITIRSEIGDSVKPIEPSEWHAKTRTDKKQVVASPDPEHESYVGTSGTSFRSPDGHFMDSICNHTWSRDYGSGNYRRFTGPMTIRFHQPNSPNVDAGIHEVGFYVSQMSFKGSLQVRLYTPTGQLIGYQSNLGLDCVFMGFHSKSKIGWIEIDPGGLFEGYSIGNLIFDEIE